MRGKFITRRYITIKEQHQINEYILDKEIRLIGADGNQLGIMSIEKAMELAVENDMDLVKISPTANPPVCKIMNYGKYKFELSKREKEAKKNQKIVELKEIRLSMTIDTNDLNVKSRQAQKFLSGGDKVKVSIKMRGRQNAHSNLGVEVMNNFYEGLKDYCTVEKKAQAEGRMIIMILAPSNSN